MEVSISNFAVIYCKYIDKFNFMGEHLCVPGAVGGNQWLLDYIMYFNIKPCRFYPNSKKLISFFPERERDLIKTIIICFQKMVYRHLYSAKWQVSLKKMD